MDRSWSEVKWYAEVLINIGQDRVCWTPCLPVYMGPGVTCPGPRAKCTISDLKEHLSIKKQYSLQIKLIRFQPVLITYGQHVQINK